MRGRIHYPLFPILAFFILGKLSAEDLSGTSQVYHAWNGNYLTITATPDEPVPKPLQASIHWIADGDPFWKWNITGNLSPLFGTNHPNVVLDFDQPCSGTISAVQYQRWVDVSDHTRMVITESKPLLPVGIDAIKLKFYYYHLSSPADLFINWGSTAPAQLRNLGPPQTRDIVEELASSNKLYQFNISKIILSRIARKADYKVTCGTPPQQQPDNDNKTTFTATPEND